MIVNPPTHITEDEWRVIVAAVCNAGLAMAVMWDTMSPHERDGMIFDGTVEMVACLAAEFDSPPELGRIDPETVKQAVLNCWRRDL